MGKFLVFALLLFSSCALNHGIFREDRYPESKEDFSVLVEQLRFITNNPTDNSILDSVLIAVTPEEKIRYLRAFFQSAVHTTFEEGWQRLAYATKEFGLLAKDHRSKIYVLLGVWTSREESTVYPAGKAPPYNYELWVFDRNDGVWKFLFVKDVYGNYVLQKVSGPE